MNQSLLELQTAAMAKADFHLAHFIQETFLNTHVRQLVKTILWVITRVFFPG